MQDNFAYCSCDHCKIVSYNSKNNIWLHCGSGIMAKETFDETENGVTIENIFEQPATRKKFTSFDSHESVGKPFGVIWFSNGSWLFDPYCEGGHDEMNMIEKKVIVIKSPKNILQINTTQEMDNFATKYGSDYISFDQGKTHIKWPYKTIKWTKVYESGYWGVAFNFRKVSHMDENMDNEGSYNKFFWHYGFDVESLCIFDIRAFNNEVTVQSIKI